MKILSYVLIFIGFAILGVLALLFLAPKSVRYEQSFQTTADPQVIWAHFTEGEKCSDWMQNLDSAGSFDPLPPNVGSKRNLYFKTDSYIETEETIKELVPLKLLTLETNVKDLLIIRHHIEIHTVEQNSTVVIRSEVHAEKRAMRFSLWGAKKGMEEQASKGIEKLLFILQHSSKTA